MANNLLAIGSTVVGEGGLVLGVAAGGRHVARRELLAAIEAAFAAEFSLLDGETGEVLHLAADHSRLDWTLRGELCREVARRNKPELIEDEDPILTLAIPLPGDENGSLVAVGVFLAGTIERHEPTDLLQRSLGAGGAETAGWISRQSPWSADVLLRVSRLLIGKLKAERLAEKRVKEIAGLSRNLASTYEEISLLYRLTQNLKLSSRDEDLGQKALDWLAAVVPVESLALLLVPLSAGAAVTHARGPNRCCSRMGVARSIRQASRRWSHCSDRIGRSGRWS